MCLYFLGKSSCLQKHSILCSFQLSFQTVFIFPFCVATTTARSILGTVTLWFVQEEKCVLYFLGFHNNIQRFAGLSQLYSRQRLGALNPFLCSAASFRAHLLIIIVQTIFPLVHYLIFIYMEAIFHSSKYIQPWTFISLSTVDFKLQFQGFLVLTSEQAQT